MSASRKTLPEARSSAERVRPSPDVLFGSTTNTLQGGAIAEPKAVSGEDDQRQVGVHARANRQLFASFTRLFPPIGALRPRSETAPSRVPLASQSALCPIMEDMACCSDGFWRWLRWPS